MMNRVGHPEHTMNRFFITAAILVCLLSFSSAFAQQFQATPAQPPVATLVTQLDDASYVIRLKATQTLLGDESLDTQSLVPHFEKAKSLEQRHRLADIIHHRVLSDYVKKNLNDDGEGAIGTTLQPALTADYMPDLNTPAVRVGQPRAGFPAYASLLPGDLIVALDGKPFPASSNPRAVESSLTTSIKGTPLGRKINVSVHRDGTTTIISIRVGSLSALRILSADNNLNSSTGIPKQWDEFVVKVPALATDAAPPATIATKPLPAINLGPALAGVPAWSMPAAGATTVQINRPPPPRVDPRRGGGSGAAREGSFPMQAPDRD